MLTYFTKMCYILVLSSAHASRIVNVKMCHLFSYLIAKYSKVRIPS